MNVVFLYGPYAVGKHTIGTRLSELTGLPLFHNHLAVDAALCLFPYGTTSFKKVRAAVWLTVFAEAAASDRSFIFTFSPEATVEPSLIQEMRRSVEERGGKVHFIELHCSRETSLQRLGNASRAKFRKLTDESLYKTLEEQGGFAFPPLPPPLISISTDELEPDEAAQRIALALKEATSDA